MALRGVNRNKVKRSRPFHHPKETEILMKIVQTGALFVFAEPSLMSDPTALTEISRENNLILENEEAPWMNAKMAIKNVGKGESILRIVLGLVCIGLAFVFSGLLAWVVGLVGVTLLLTAFFGY